MAFACHPRVIIYRKVPIFMFDRSKSQYNSLFNRQNMKKTNSQQRGIERQSSYAVINLEVLLVLVRKE
jgi:hypothetical protein